MLRALIFSVFILLAHIASLSQQGNPNFVKRYLHKFTGDTTEKSRPQNLIYPTISYTPETKWEFGLSTVLIGYAKKDTNNRLSELRTFSFITSLKQYGFLLDHAFYSHKDRWFILGLLKMQSFPLAYHGIGYNSPKEKIAIVEAFTFNWRERLLHKIFGSLYMGLELDYQQLSGVHFKANTNDVSMLHPTGYTGYHNFGAGIGLLYDTRHNVLNVRKGLFVEMAFLNYPKTFGGSNNFSSVFSDLRFFYPVRKRNVIALQTIGQFTLGNAPFSQLALMGGEMMMRGYYLGRFRDKNYLSIQAEYRMLPLNFAKKFGLAIFASLGGVYDKVIDVTPKYLKYASGAGLHYLLFPGKDVWTRLDFAINNEGGGGIYLYIGCAF